VTPPQTTVYNIICSGQGGSARASTTVTVGNQINPNPLSPYSKFILGDTVITTANLNLRVQPNTGSNIQYTVPLGIQGTVYEGPVSANGYFWYRVTFTNGMSGWGVENYLYKVTTGTGTGPTNLSPSLSLIAIPENIAVGGSSSISWVATNATSCLFSNSSVIYGTNGIISIKPPQTTTYDLTCWGTNGSANQSVTVTVGGSSGSPINSNPQ
jgi:hypothetical protein